MFGDERVREPAESAGPERAEWMGKETLNEVMVFARRSRFKTITEKLPKRGLPQTTEKGAFLNN